MDPLSPWLAIVGGLLIGGAATVPLLLSGRIAGVSGMLAAAAGATRDAAPWKHAAAFVVGLPIGALLGAGLVLSDMINPARVLAFLDVAGAWDATLLFVMGGAVFAAAMLAGMFLHRGFFNRASRTPALLVPMDG